MKKALRALGAILALLLCAAELCALPAAAEAVADLSKITPPHY